MARPFKGISFCSTGISNHQHSEIHKIIISLGGIFTDGLLGDTQVLIMDDTNKYTKKYRYCVRQRPDMIFLEKKVLVEFYELWQSGEDITRQNEYQQFDNNHSARMLYVLRQESDMPLANFLIFIGRINPLKDNCNVKDLVEITKELGCSKVDGQRLDLGLIGKHADATDQIFIANQETSTRQRSAALNGLPIVHYKWLLDCQKRGAALEYDPYYLVGNTQGQTFEEIGSGSCACWEDLKRLRNLETSIERMNSDYDEERNTHPSILLNKFKPEGGKLWQRVMSSNTNDNKNKHSSGQNQLESKHIKTPIPASRQSSTVSNNLMLRKSPERLKPIFDNCTFGINEKFPSKHHRILLKVIKKNGGTIVTSPLTDPDYLIVPSNVPWDELDTPDETSQKSIIVTEFFIERCLHYKELIHPPDSWSKPFLFTNNFHLEASPNLIHKYKEGERNISVSITGFQGVELLHLTKILHLLEGKGIHFSENVNKSTDLLLINIAALPSLDPSFSLWQNNYSDLFQLNKKQLNNENDNQTAVFRNSLKRKLAFVKHVNDIRVTSPAFIMDIFRKTSHFLNPLDTKDCQIRINDRDWCIICPKGRTNDHELRIIKGPLLEHGKNQNTTLNVSSRSKEMVKVRKPTHIKPRSHMISKSIYKAMNGSSDGKLSPISSSSSIKKTMKENVKDIINTVNQPTPAARIKRKVSDSSSVSLNLSEVPNLSRSSSNLDHNIKVSGFNTKRQMIEPGIIKEGLDRTSSWGTMMSNENDHLKKEVDNPDTEVPIPHNNEDVVHTQIVYGAGTDNSKQNSVNRAPLTRHRTKELQL